MTEQYWAAKSTTECVEDALHKIDRFYSYLIATGRFALWRTCYSYYHAIFGQENEFKPLGDAYSLMRVNHFRNLLQHLLTMTVNQRPAFEPRATNSDHASQAQALLARGLLDYYMREKSLEINLKDAVEYALLYGEGFCLTEWDPNLGEVYAVNPDTRSEVRQGDVTYSTLAPVDVIRDVALYQASKSDWYIVRRQRNKYDLAANFPELADDITAFTEELRYQQQLIQQHVRYLKDSDLISTYTLYHARTPALPNGRMTVFLDGSTILTDGPLPYRDLPIYRVAPAEQAGTPFGYSVMFDLLPIQDTLNGLYSTVKTNQETFGVQSILLPKGSGIGTMEVVGGLNFIEYDPSSAGGKPEALQLTKTAPEVFTFIGGVEKLLETISGVNSVARGDPQASLKSGAALALVQSQAIQFSQGLQNAYTRLLEGVGQATINMLRDYASAPRVAMIAGRANRAEMREFTGKDLENVNRVSVDQGNPVMRTTAGKVDLAQMMVQLKLIDTPEQLLQVIQTGNLDPLTEGSTNELLNIKGENEALADGKTVPVMITDDHAVHVREHKCVLSDPAARQDANIIKIVTDHLLQHMHFLQDPSIASLLAVLGQQPVPPSQPGGLGLGNPGQGGGALRAPVAAPGANQLAEANQPKLPRPPVNPLTHQPAPLAPGTSIQ